MTTKKQSQSRAKPRIKPKIMYEENDSLRLKTVVTVDGTTEYSRNCKFILGKYYKTDIQCVLVGKKWYPINSEEIAYDHETKKYVLRGSSILYDGIVGYENEQFVFGRFSQNGFKNCRVGYIDHNGSRNEKVCISYEIPKRIGYIEHVNDDIWASAEYMKNPFKQSDIPTEGQFHSEAISRLTQVYNKTSDFTKIKMFKFPNNAYNAEESGNFEFMKKEFQKFNTTLTKDVRRAAKLIGDLTFGCEIETKMGNIPQYYHNQLGIIVCKDGSIGYTPEFVTIPYSGAKGLQSLKNLFIELNKRCTTDYSCSLHFHIGGIRRDREFLIALYKLYCDIQIDLHKMLPYYKTDPSGVKDKNYCQFLHYETIRRFLTSKNVPYKERVSKAYVSLFGWVLEGQAPSKTFNRKNKKHPNGNQKWNQHGRYSSLNFLNMFFSKRQTIEFRGHHAVLHPSKAINWFFICVAIIKYAERHSGSILSKPSSTTTIKQVLMYYADTFKTEYAKKVSSYLTAYYDMRCDYFKRMRATGDAVCQEDYTSIDFEFVHNEMKELF